MVNSFLLQMNSNIMKSRSKKLSEGDVVVFKASDFQFRALICSSSYKIRSALYFNFLATSIEQLAKPTLTDIMDAEFYGTANSRDEGYYRYKDSEIEQMWKVHPEIKPSYIGSYDFMISRKTIVSKENHFLNIGNISIPSNIEMHGNGGMNVDCIDCIDELFTDDIHTRMSELGQKLFKIRAIAESE